MLQVLQRIRDGRLEVADVPPPRVSRGFAVVETSVSAISVGTEKAVRDLAQKSLAGKARERPDLVRQVIERVARDGIASTYDIVMGRMESSMPLGYSNAGVIVDVDRALPGLHIGDRVACGGAGYANHAEVLSSKHLIARIPDRVTDEQASFTTIGAIALQGARIAQAQLGECVVVIGLGLIGLLATQMLEAAGCRVVGVELAPERRQLALRYGAIACFAPSEDVAGAVHGLTDGIGADVVLIAASTSGSEPLELAGEVARHKARVALVGATGMEIPRRPFYEKELAIYMSTSYGPGRYDASYEEAGHDYPVGYVRWTEQRNMLEVLRLFEVRKLRVDELVTHRIPVARAAEAYELLQDGDRGAAAARRRPRVPGSKAASATSRNCARSPLRSSADQVRVALVGAGLYARSVLMPALHREPSIRVVAVVSRGGQSAMDLAATSRFGIEHATSDLDLVLADPTIDAVVVATRHDSHAALACRALEAGKHVLVEKPPATNTVGLSALRTAWSAGERALRSATPRFSRWTIAAREALLARADAAQRSLQRRPTSSELVDARLGARWRPVDRGGLPFHCMGVGPRRGAPRNGTRGGRTWDRRDLASRRRERRVSSGR